MTGWADFHIPYKSSKTLCCVTKGLHLVKLLGYFFKSIVSGLVFIHLTLLNSITFSGGGGSIFSLGGLHPCFFHIAWTSDPEDHLKSFVGVDG
jgi:hypothetical protein